MTKIFSALAMALLLTGSITAATTVNAQDQMKHTLVEEAVCGAWSGKWSMKSYSGPAQIEISCDSPLKAIFKIEKTGKNRNKTREWSIVGSIEGDTITFSADWGVTKLTLISDGDPLRLEGSYRLTGSGEKGEYKLTKAAD